MTPCTWCQELRVGRPFDYHECLLNRKALPYGMAMYETISSIRAQMERGSELIKPAPNDFKARRDYDQRRQTRQSMATGIKMNGGTVQEGY